MALQPPSGAPCQTSPALKGTDRRCRTNTALFRQIKSMGRDMGRQTANFRKRSRNKNFWSCMAERVGFEPTVLVKVHTLSKRAP